MYLQIYRYCVLYRFFSNNFRCKFLCKSCQGFLLHQYPWQIDLLKHGIFSYCLNPNILLAQIYRPRIRELADETGNDYYKLCLSNDLLQADLSGDSICLDNILD